MHITELAKELGVHEPVEVEKVVKVKLPSYLEVRVEIFHSDANTPEELAGWQIVMAGHPDIRLVDVKGITEQEITALEMLMARLAKTIR